MDKIIVRSGIELIEIKGVYLLVADRQARKECRYIQSINEVGAFIWNALKKGYTIEEIKDSIRLEYQITEDYDLNTDIYAFIENLRQNHYIICLKNTEM